MLGTRHSNAARGAPGKQVDPQRMTTDAPLMLQQLKAAMASGDRASVNRACLALVESQPPLGRQWQSIAAVLQHNGEHRSALRATAAWQAQEPANSQARFQHAANLALAGRPGEALALLDGLPDDVPDPAGNAYLKGTVSINLGDRQRALAELRRGIARHPRSGQIWLALAMAGPLGEEDGSALRSAAARFAAAPDDLDKASFLYALGKLQDEQRDDAAAFESFSKGAAIMRGLRSFDLAGDSALARDLVAGWTGADIAGFGKQVEAGGARPIFVTGLPRSGTTLVEQILASHSAVAGGEELGLMRLVGQDIGGFRRADWDRFLARGGDPQALRDLYLHLLEERFPQPGRVVDKTLAASRHLGVVASLFPDAPIIWMRRDPADCAWSAFRTYFARSVDWSWSFETIAGFFQNEDLLFEHWTRKLGDRILVVPYAELVADPKSWTERITRFAGLEPEAAQDTPHLSPRTVTTASATQVREPINRKGLGSSAPYHAQMKPFFDLYRPVSAG